MTLPFEKAFQELQAILEQMNSGSLSLEDSIHLYEQGEQRMRYCESLLKAAEQKIEQIAKGAKGETLLNTDQTLKTAPLFSKEE